MESGITHGEFVIMESLSRLVLTLPTVSPMVSLLFLVECLGV